MKILKKLFILALACLLISALISMSMSAPLTQNQTDQKKIIGIWQGSLKVPGTELRIVFNISQPANDSLAATLDSPDQGAFGIPVSKVTFLNDSIKIEVAGIGGLFEGMVAADLSAIDGQWKQSGMSFPLALKRVDEAPKLNRPQDPQKPYPYLEEEVIYKNEQASIQLAGTLTLPSSKKTYPAVLLITGSGAQDRNETIFAHRPFLVLADYLTRQGVAVLRVDDRGVGGSTGNMVEATTEDFASDVLAGVNYLKTRKEIDPRQIGLIGHSEGGIIAPKVASQSKDIAFIVLMAGTGLPGEEILYLQGALIAKANGASDSAVARTRESQERIFSVLKQENDDSSVVVKLSKVMQVSHEKLSEEEQKAIGDADVYIKAQIKQFTSPWFRFFLTYDPIPALKQVKCPVLAINGELDLQVPPKENLSAIEAALKAGGNMNYTIKVFPKLNHLFQTAETGAPSEYGKIEETISPDVLKFMGDWILKLVAK